MSLKLQDLPVSIPETIGAPSTLNETGLLDEMPDAVEHRRLQPHAQNCRQDRSLADRCVAGEVGAWEELYDLFGKPLATLVRFLLGTKSSDDSLVDEITSRVWLALIANDGALLNRYDPNRGARLITYLRLLARDEIKRHFRSEVRRRRRDEVAGCRANATYCSDALFQSSIAEFSEQLTPKEKEFFWDYLVSEAPDSDLDAERPSHANVWQLRHRIRKKLVKFLEE